MTRTSEQKYTWYLHILRALMRNWWQYFNYNKIFMGEGTHSNANFLHWHWNLKEKGPKAPFDPQEFPYRKRKNYKYLLVLKTIPWTSTAHIHTVYWPHTHATLMSCSQCTWSTNSLSKLVLTAGCYHYKAPYKLQQLHWSSFLLSDIIMWSMKGTNKYEENYKTQILTLYLGTPTVKLCNFKNA